MTDERLYLISGLVVTAWALSPLLPRPQKAPRPVVTTPLRAAGRAGFLPCGDTPTGWFLRDGERVERCVKGHEFVRREGTMEPAY